MKTVVLMLAGALVGCAGDLSGDGGDPPSDAQPSSDAGQSCSVALSWEPQAPVASDNVKLRVDAFVDAPGGIFDYSWSVERAGVAIPFEEAQPNESAIQFAISEAGVYDVLVYVSASGSCPTGQAAINVDAQNASIQEMRVRVRPPVASGLPPEDRFVQVKGGVDEYSIGSIVIDAGRLVSGRVVDATTSAPVPAYLKLAPVAAPDAFVEHFTGDDGSFGVRVVSEPHDVLVIPSIEGYAPMRVSAWSPGQPMLSLDRGTEITGTVRDSANAPIANAKVQLTIAGVPSTLATTESDGTFRLLARPAAAAPVVVDVAPPASSGLPRLVATSTALAPQQGIAVAYSIGVRDVGTAVVQRDGVAVPNARVTFVGALANVGSVSTGGAPVTARGVARIAVTADATGKLASALAPRAALSAVTLVAANDLAVSAVDLTSPPVTVDAPPRVAVETQIVDDALVPLPGAVLDAVPDAALALAGALPQRSTANSAGAIVTLWPAGSRFDVRIHDPLGRGSLKRLEDVTPLTLAAQQRLGVPLLVVGRVTASDTLQPIRGSSVQLLCSDCTGIARGLPEGEGVSAASGEFRIVIPDPGTSM